MLHVGVLPFHRGWANFLRNLKFVVIDEAHMYRGVFGTHVAMILRRLRRLCRSYGSNPQFVLCSATLANAGEHARLLTGLDHHVVDDDGSPSSGRTFVFWNPLGDDEDSNGSINIHVADLTANLVARDVKTMTFARSRTAVERICEFARDKLRGQRSQQIQPYRAGYLADQRRQTEQQLKQDVITGLVTTNAMELGVDVGGIDATVLAGYPGTVSSVWQQAGRSGRSREKAVSVLVGRNHPADQYFMQNPAEFFSHPYEAARISVTNPMLLEQHLKCAAREQPLGRRDFDIFDERSMREVAYQMVQDGILQVNADNTRSLAVDEGNNPAFDVNIRSMDSERWSVVDTRTGQVLEETDSHRVFMEMYPGAILMHRGDYYTVDRVDADSMNVLVRLESNTYYYTVLNIETAVKVINVETSHRVGSSKVSFGNIEVRLTADQFTQKHRYTDEVLAVNDIETEPRVYRTKAVWFEEPLEYRGAGDVPVFSPSVTSGAYYAMEYPAATALAMLTMCDTSDVGAASYLSHPDIGNRAVLFIWDAHPGGVGISEAGYTQIPRVWDRMARIIDGCPCSDGCPRCVEAPNRMADENTPDKRGASRVLRHLLEKYRTARSNGAMQRSQQAVA